MTIIFIDERKILGIGNERVCFIHPDDSSKCIKINKPGVIHRNQNKIESYYLSGLKQRKIPFTHLAEFYGEIDTDRGKGLMFERILDQNGSPSIPLQQAIEQSIISTQHTNELLNELKQYLITNAIYIGDCNKDQLLVQRNGNGMHLKVIDGLGTRRYGLKLKLLSHIPWYARYKIHAKWPTIKNNYLF